MKKLAILFAFALASCGSGGGGGGGPIPGGGSSMTTLNTAVPDYLPAASGNYWNFSTGARMVDGGSYTLTCSCPGDGVHMERIELYDPGSSTISSSFFFAKNTPEGGTQLTNMIGVENDSGTNNMTGSSTATYPYGEPVMDDSPRANEQWSDGSGDTSTIVSTGATLSISSSSQIVGVATDQMTGNYSTITWGFAHGVGFTKIGVGTQTMNISSFYVNASTSTSSGSRPELAVTRRAYIGSYGDVRASAASALQHLF